MLRSDWKQNGVLLIQHCNPRISKLDFMWSEDERYDIRTDKACENRRQTRSISSSCVWVLKIKCKWAQVVTSALEKMRWVKGWMVVKVTP